MVEDVKQGKSNFYSSSLACSNSAPKSLAKNLEWACKKSLIIVTIIIESR
jgi:hypothetical protein